MPQYLIERVRAIEEYQTIQIEAASFAEAASLYQSKGAFAGTTVDGACVVIEEQYLSRGETDASQFAVA